MKHLVHIKEKIKKAKRLSDPKLMATKNREFMNYKSSVFEKRQKEAQKHLENKKFK